MKVYKPKTVLQDIGDLDGVLPFGVGDTIQKQPSNDPAFLKLQGATRDVGFVSGFRLRHPYLPL